MKSEKDLLSATRGYHYRLVLAYDGTDFRGWQDQGPTITTVAKELQDSFFKIFNRQIKLTGSSRTDAGVHAVGQVAAFFTDIDVEPQSLRNAWNNVLPPSILVRSAGRAQVGFHPQHNVAYKTYCYHFFTQRPLPQFARYGFFYRYPIDIQKLNRCLQVFVGTHDFASFCTQQKGDCRDTVRTIDEARVVYVPQLRVYRIYVQGHSFLHYMVRRIVGACLEVASRSYLDESDLIRELAAKNPQQSLPKAPANGLVLWKIRYR